jgi:hypothetical protein
MNLIRIYLALALVGAGALLFALQALLWGDAVAGACCFAGCLLVAEIVRPSGGAVQDHARKAHEWARENGQDV